MKLITILSYNIGHLCLLKPWKHIPIWSQGKVFFWHKDIPFIQSIVKKIKPDIVFLQELTSEQNVEFLADKLGFQYFSYCKVSHLTKQNLGTGILHNFKNAQIKITKSEVSLHSLCWDEYIFTTVHLDPFSTHHRTEQVKAMVSYVQKNPKSKHIIGGDFNLGTWKGRWLNKRDSLSYKLLTSVLHDATNSISSTHIIGNKLDYILTSPDISVRSTHCMTKVHGSMDHYPVSTVIDIEERDKKDIVMTK